jgi:hypothetical protein
MGWRARQGDGERRGDGSDVATIQHGPSIVAVDAPRPSVAYITARNGCGAFGTQELVGLRRYLDRQGPTMLFTIFCCFSTGLVVYCILNRVHRKAIEIAVSLAVRDIEKESERRNDELMAQLNAKDGELTKARNLVKLHEAVPTMSRVTPGQAAKPGTAKPGSAKPVARPTGSPPAKLPERKLKQDPLNVFEMSRPFTDTSYDALLASSDVVKIEPAGG